MPLILKIKIKIFVGEIAWLFVSACVTLLLTFLFFKDPFFKSSLTIHIYDTYFIFSIWQVLIPLFLLLTFIIYFFKERHKLFSRIFQKWLTIIFGLAFILYLMLIFFN